MTLKAEMLMKEKVGSSERFDRSNPSRRPYNEISRFGPTDKGKAASQLKRDNEQVETNKLNKPHAMPMIAKCFKCGEPEHRSSDFRREIGQSN
jgi:hypothetical protein